jgi:hypothetical protein
MLDNLIWTQVLVQQLVRWSGDAEILGLDKNKLVIWELWGLDPLLIGILRI